MLDLNIKITKFPLPNFHVISPNSTKYTMDMKESKEQNGSSSLEKKVQDGSGLLYENETVIPVEF